MEHIWHGWVVYRLSLHSSGRYPIKQKIVWCAQKGIPFPLSHSLFLFIQFSHPAMSLSHQSYFSVEHPQLCSLLHACKAHLLLVLLCVYLTAAVEGRPVVSSWVVRPWWAEEAGSDNGQHFWNESMHVCRWGWWGQWGRIESSEENENKVKIKMRNHAADWASYCAPPPPWTSWLQTMSIRVHFAPSWL